MMTTVYVRSCALNCVKFEPLSCRCTPSLSTACCTAFQSVPVSAAYRWNVCGVRKASALSGTRKSSEPDLSTLNVPSAIARVSHAKMTKARCRAPVDCDDGWGEEETKATEERTASALSFADIGCKGFA